MRPHDKRRRTYEQSLRRRAEHGHHAAALLPAHAVRGEREHILPWHPPDVYRKPDPIWPKNHKIDIKKMVKDKIVSKLKSIFGDEE